VPIAYSCKYLAEAFVDTQNQSNYKRVPLPRSFLIDKSLNDIMNLHTELSPFSADNISQVRIKQSEYKVIDRFIQIGLSRPRIFRGKKLIAEIIKKGFIQKMLRTTLLSFEEKIVMIIRSIYWILDYFLRPKQTLLNRK